MRINLLNIKSLQMQTFAAKKHRPDGAQGANPVYAAVKATDDVQISTVKKALEELKEVEYLPNDLIYMHAIGAKPPFNNGLEAYNWLKESGAEILYADFSNKNVHACLNFDTQKGITILINSNYKDDCTHADILAISEAIFHECGHGKDFDSENSIQEELDCLSLNVLAHRYYERKYPNVFKNHDSFLFSQGVSLYPKLFFNFYKTALKNRVAEKYGYLQSGDDKHKASKIAMSIKQIYKNATLI